VKPFAVTSAPTNRTISRVRKRPEVAVRLRRQANALCPVMCLPTMRDWISAVPS
jgi:hypothetical protein